MDENTGVTITLVVPVYNVEEYLGQCLDSIVKQLVPFDEVILVDDGSTDGSAAICERYVSGCGYFKLLSQENRGLSAARNRGMGAASGRYVMFLDSDDYLREDTVKVLKGMLEKARYDAVFFDADICREGEGGGTGRNIYDRGHSGLDGREWDGRTYFAQCYPLGYVVSACMAVYRKRVIDDGAFVFPEGMYYEDNYFSFLFLNHAGTVVHIPEKLYRRRYRENSITGSFTEKHFMDYMKVCRLIWEEIRRECRGGLLPGRKRTLMALVCDHCAMILGYRRKCTEEGILPGSGTEGFLKETVGEYFALMQAMDFDLPAGLPGLDLSMLARVLEIFHGISRLGLLPGTETAAGIHGIVRMQRELYIGLLEKLPFNRESSRVGIYGTGKHTEGMLAVYRELMGEIRCSLVFLDSRKDRGTYRGREVVHYREVDRQDLDLVVISSFVYEREMAGNLDSVQAQAPVFTFYDGLDGDIFSGGGIFLECCRMFPEDCGPGHR